MPTFDPTFPAFHSEVASEAYRNQFNSLKELADAGVPGPQGEVSSAQLDAAISGTARTPSAFPPYTGTFSDPVTQAEMLAYVAYVEQMRQELLR